MGTGASVFVSSTPASGHSPREESVFTFPSITASSTAEQTAEDPPLISPTTEHPAEVSQLTDTAVAEPKIGILVQKTSEVMLTTQPLEEKEEKLSSPAMKESSLSPPRSPSTPSLKERTRGLFRAAMTSFKSLSPARPKRSGSRRRTKQPSEHKAVLVVRRLKDRHDGRDVVFKQDYATIPGSAELVQLDEPVKTPRLRPPSPFPGASGTLLSEVPDKLTPEELGLVVGKLELYAELLGYPPEDISLFKRNARLWVRYVYDALAI